MGGPKGPVKTIKEGLSNSADDILTSANQVGSGQVEQGLTNYGAGILGLMSTGFSQKYLPGETATTNAAKDAAAAAATDTTLVKASADQAKLDKINNRLKEEVRLRQKSPGKAQTLLTSTLTPNSTNTGTILTGAGR